jgi:hypothetical protein
MIRSNSSSLTSKSSRVGEELAGGKGDQGQLPDRGAVLLLGRAQNGEVHQIHRGVGFQDVAPGPLARVRLAGDQQDPQALAHAVDHHGGVVVDQGELVRARLDRDLQHAGPAVVQLELDLFFPPDRQHDGARLPAVLGQGHLGQVARAALWQVVDPEGQGQPAPDDAVAGRLDHGQAAVPLVLSAAEQEVERRVERQGFQILRHVVDHTVADHHDGADPLARDLGERPAQGGEEPCAPVLRAEARRLATDHAQLDVLELGEPLQHVGQRRLALLLAVLDPLAGAVVDHHQHDVRERLALFLHQGGVGQDQQQQARRRGPPPGPISPAPKGQRQNQRGEPREGRQRRPRQERRPGDGELRAHWPNRSRMKGTCTWSAL